MQCTIPKPMYAKERLGMSLSKNGNNGDGVKEMRENVIRI